MYNNRGWSYSLFTDEDIILLNEKFNELNTKTKQRTDNVLMDGTRIVEVNNKVVLIGGTFKEPQVHNVVVFNADNETIANYFKDVIINDSKQYAKTKFEFTEIVQNAEGNIGKETIREYCQDVFKYIRSRDSSWSRAEIPSYFKNYGYSSDSKERGANSNNAGQGVSKIQVDDSDTLFQHQSNNIVNNNSMQESEEDVLYQSRDVDSNTITPDMDDNKRTEILRNKSIELVEYTGKHELSEDVVERFKNNVTKNANKILRDLGEKFGIYKNYSNKNIDFEFNYSRGTLKESVHKQSELKTDFSDFAKMMYVFDDVVKNAIPIEVHTDKYLGTKRANPNLKYDYVFVSAFFDEKYIIPIELHLKEFKPRANEKNKLYVSVTLSKIKMEDNVMTGTYDTNKNVDSYANVRLSSKISLPHLISKVNPNFGNFYKYIPSELLNEEQIISKQNAVEKERDRLRKMKNQCVDTDSDTLFQQRADGGYSNRKLLAKVLESTVKTKYEKAILTQYKNAVNELDKKQKALLDVEKKSNKKRKKEKFRNLNCFV